MKGAMEKKIQIANEKDQAVISFFRGKDDVGAIEFRELKQKQYLLQARKQLAVEENLFFDLNK